MRERLTVSFVLLTLALLALAGTVRAWTMERALGEREVLHLQEQATAVARVVRERVERGQPVTQTLVAEVTPVDSRVVVTGLPGGPVRADGPDFTGDGDGDQRVAARFPGGSVTVSQDEGRVLDPWAGGGVSIVVLVVVLLLLAGTAAFLLARALSAPFVRLAEAAGALGRGRFDLDLPRTTVPEARAIGQALQTSADQLQERIRREHEFAEHASHVLRTPLTGLRLELEELSQRADVPDDVRAMATRALVSVDGVDVVAGELVQLARRSSLVAGAEIPLQELATQVAQRWADRLADDDRELTAAVEGGLDQLHTPGPVELVCDLLLAHVVAASAGAVRVVLQGGDHLRVRVTAERRPRSGAPTLTDTPLVRARAVVGALGGRIAGDDPVDGVEVLLPRR